MVKKKELPGLPKPQPTQENGPYTWGNGPKPYGVLKRLAMKLKGK